MKGRVIDMLALTRKKGEALVINNNIEVTVLEIRGDQIKLGIAAPKEVPVYRKEVYLQIQKENEAALSVNNLSGLKGLLK
jgi:carbon storage regulator